MIDSVMDEITRKIPPAVIAKYGDAALFVAYGCVLLEYETGKSYTYKAVNITTGRSAAICRNANPLTNSGVASIVEKIRLSSIVGMGRYEIDMPPGSNLTRDSLIKIQVHIFRNILPEHGYGVREQQIELATHILDTMSRRAVSLSEAEVGTGKTHAYLFAAALVKRGRVNDFWLRGHYPNQSYAESAHQPIVISTSSIALQNAVAKEYIPEISRILMENGIIKKPLSCVIRKGREHYACEKNLQAYNTDADKRARHVLSPLLQNAGSIDLGALNDLTPYVKRRVGVTGRCGRDCPYYENCRYLRYMRSAKSNKHDFQICNHNYLLADILRRSKGQEPLIPDYQAIIIDEGHKFLAAARQMYGAELSRIAIARITGDIRSFTYHSGESGADIQKLSVSLYEQSERLFTLLNENIPESYHDDETERYKTVMDARASRYLRNICRIIGELVVELPEKPLLARYNGRRKQALWELGNIKEQAAVLEKHRDLIYWLEKPGKRQSGQNTADETLLCAIPKQLNDILYRDIWRGGVPVILTSGTLSAGGDFGHIKKSLGLDKLRAGGLMETSKPSPFNLRENALLYISETMPFPDNKNRQYIMAVADETERLIKAAYGHTAVLFTSYKAMDMVYEILAGRGMGFPLFRLNRGSVNAIEQFRQSGNGVLFASGALWEGIDIPGDILSMLVIVKLPFAVPDPISEYERTLYKSMGEYKNAVIVPEMLIKLKQGFGRLIRTEWDTGAVAILDSRANKRGAYRERALNALPDCRVTDKLEDISDFIRTVKSPDYFE